MGRTLPTTRGMFHEEIAHWRKMREGFKTKEERELFDAMLNLSLQNASEASMACSPIPLDAVFMSILFELYKKVVTGKFTHESGGFSPKLEDF